MANYHRPGAAALRNARQEAFCLAVASGLAAIKAAEQAGYSPKSVRPTAWRLMNRPHIRERIQLLIRQRLVAAGVDRNAVVARVVEMAFAEMGQFLEWDENGEMQLVPSSSLAPEVRAAISSIKVTQHESRNSNGEVTNVRTTKEVRLEPRQPWMQLLARLLSLVEDEHPVADGLRALADAMMERRAQLGVAMPRQISPRATRNDGEVDG